MGGGSIAAICGLSPHSTALDAFFHIVEPEKFSEEERDFFENRKALESYACARFTKHTGLHLTDFNKRHDDKFFPWAKAEIDASISGSSSVEVKTVRESMAHMWDNPGDGGQPPAYVEIQLQWGFGVCPWIENGYVMALIGFDRQYIYQVDRNPEAIEIARRKAANFWQFHVMPKRPPQPTTVEDILKLYPRDSGRKVEVTAAIADDLEKICRIKTDIAFRANAKERHEFAVKDFMRDAAVLTQRGKPIATWKQDKRGVRVLRIL